LVSSSTIPNDLRSRGRHRQHRPPSRLHDAGVSNDLVVVVVVGGVVVGDGMRVIVEMMPTFGYEVYVVDVDRLRDVLDEFELRLVRGVASSLGLVVDDDDGEGGCGGTPRPAAASLSAAVARSDGSGPTSQSSGTGGTRGTRTMTTTTRRRRTTDSLARRRIRRQRRRRRGTIATTSVAGVSSEPADVPDPEYHIARRRSSWMNPPPRARRSLGP